MFTLQSYIAEAEKEPIDVSGHEPVVIAPGRFNPPHMGHKLMIDKLIQLGKRLGAKPVVVIVDSGKYDARNPLPGEVRQQYLQKMFPMVDFVIKKNPYFAVYDLHAERNQVPVGGVTGADRADSYKKMVGRIFGPEVENNYQAEVLHRDPDAEGDVAGASATKAREAAANNDEAAFRAITGLGHEDAVQLMAQVRKGMGVE